jgi:zinc protease
MRLVLLALLLATPALAQPKVDPAFAKSGISDWAKPPAATKEPTSAADREAPEARTHGSVSTNKALPIAMSLVIPGAGAANDPAGKGGIAAFTADLLDEGTAGMSALAIAEELDRLGASFGAGVAYDAAEVSMSTLSKTLDPSIELFTKIVTAPAFEDKEVERVKGDRGTALELRRDRPREVAQIMLAAALYGGATAYGHPTSGTREEFKTIAAADAKQFYAERYNPATMTLVVAGDVDANALKTNLDAGSAHGSRPA